MSMVVYPSLTSNSVGNASPWISKMSAILCKQNQGFVKDIFVDGSLFAVCTKIWDSTLSSVGFGDGTTHMVEELNCFSEAFNGIASFK